MAIWLVGNHRPQPIEYPGALYHITSRGNEKRNIFLGEADREKVLHILKEYHNRHGILVHAYGLMDNPPRFRCEKCGGVMLPV